MSIFCALLGLWCAAAPAPAETVAPPVAVAAAVGETIAGRASVRDGDTIEIGGRVVRLQGIDAPESGQTCDDASGAAWRCGRDSAAALDRIVGGRTVACQTDPRDARDRYGRALAICAAGGRDIGLALLDAGMAVAYRRYLDWPDRSARPHKAAYLAAESAARTARRGMWAGRFDLPEIWRRARPNGRTAGDRP